jgi:hypothetical protein
MLFLVKKIYIIYIYILCSEARMKIIVLAFLLLATQALAGPVSHFGALKRCGKNICGSKNGTESTAIFFKGPSLYWSDGTGTPFYNIETVDWFVDNLQIGVIRAAMAIKWYKDGSEPVNKPGGVAGYLQNNKDGQKNYIKKVIDAAIANDIYVIVDWHSHNAHDETNEAKNFFVDMANEYKNVPNIIWEVYNEPINVSSSQVNSHAKTIVDALKTAGNTNLVLIGSPSYSTQPSGQTSGWSSTDNVAFTFHFYAGSHTYPNAGGGSSANSTMSSNHAVFATEWGAVNADGGGSVNSGSSDTWTNWMDDQKISNCMWNASNLGEASSMFPTTANLTNLNINSLTNSGNYFKTYMGKNKWTAQRPSNHPKGNDIVVSADDGTTVTLSSSQLGLDGDITEVKSRDASIPVEVTNTANSITYKADGSKRGKIVLIYKVTKGSTTIQSKITVNLNKRLPVVPDKDPIAVSRKAPTTLNLVTDLSVEDPVGKGVQLVSASVEPSSMGRATTSGTDIVFTPDASQNNTSGAQATLKYTVKNDNGSRTASVVLKIQNFAPTIRPITNVFAPTVPNTGPVTIDLDRFNGRDKDGDALKFSKMYLDPQYPGRLEKVKDDEYKYYPESGKIGTVSFLAVITDGSLSSPVGRANITLTGSGSDIGNLTPPTSIPDYEEPTPPEPPVAVYQLNAAKSMGLASVGFGKIGLYLARNGAAKLDVYSLSGKKIGSLLSGYQNSGSKEVSLNSLNLQKGVYILRLSQGSEVKTLRVVN